MPLASGTRLGPYEIVSPAGAGGMGEVYRAVDTRLNRTVAIKILPIHLSEKPEALERFQREARAISQLSHANICQLYDIGQQDGIHYLVMEYLEGETLASRLMKGRLPLEQVMRYGAEIADGLDAAHRSGVVHRDLKPGNVMLTRAGAKLLDFGLAKSTVPLSTKSSDLAATLTSEHVSAPLTAEGTVIGTYQYMSPEQLEGKEADARSDIFSFGAVLYEMATGKRAFEGKSQVSVASAILEKDPEPVTTHHPTAPAALQNVVQGALMKEPDSRWQSAADIARQLRWMSNSPSAGITALPAHRSSRRRERALWALLAMGLLAALAWVVIASRPHARLVRASITAPPGAIFDFLGDFSGPPVLSPDGTRIAFAARTPKDRNTIWVRRLDSDTADKIPGTDGAYGLFWSGDSKWLGFFSDGKLRKVAASGGPVTTLAEAPNARGGAWNRDNLIVYAPDYRDALWKINAGGGTPQRCTSLDANKHTTHRWPSFLPDGSHFLFYATNHAGGRREDNGIYVGAIDGGPVRFVLSTESAGLYASGYLLYHQQNALMAQKFNPSRGTLSGEPIAIADNVENDAGTFRSVFTVAEGGLLLYEPGSQTGVGDTDLVRVDRAGKVLGHLAERAPYYGGSLSPDGKRLAISMGDPKPEIWVLDLEHGSRTRLTFDDAIHLMPSWSRDGTRVAYMAQYGSTFVGGTSLHSRLANGGGRDELLLSANDEKGIPATLSWPQWSPDGKYLVYIQQAGPTGASIWYLPLSPAAQPQLLVKPETPAGKVISASLSPDGRWLAYSANDGIREEIYVTTFPSGSGRWQITREGGTDPAWRGDGKEIYNIGSDSKLYATEVNPRADQIEVGKSVAIFDVRNVFPLGAPYNASPDGKTFLLLTQPEASLSPMTLVLNWPAELR